MTGRWFAPAQGGTFAPGPVADLVRRMARVGRAGRGAELVGARGTCAMERSAVKISASPFLLPL